MSTAEKKSSILDEHFDVPENNWRFTVCFFLFSQYFEAARFGQASLEHVRYVISTENITFCTGGISVSFVAPPKRKKIAIPTNNSGIWFHFIQNGTLKINSSFDVSRFNIVSKCSYLCWLWSYMLLLLFFFSFALVIHSFSLQKWIVIYSSKNF